MWQGPLSAEKTPRTGITDSSIPCRRHTFCAGTQGKGKDQGACPGKLAGNQREQGAGEGGRLHIPNVTGNDRSGPAQRSICLEYREAPDDCK